MTDATVGDPATEAAPRAIVGVGNPIMGDDGVGDRVIETLSGLPSERTAGIRLYHAGTTAFLALEAMSGSERAVVVDAIRDGAEPGTIHRYRYADGAFAGEVPRMTMHDVSFAEALRAGAGAYDLPGEVLVLGVEPARVEPTTELSDAVERSVPDLAEAALAAVDPERSVTDP